MRNLVRMKKLEVIIFYFELFIKLQKGHVSAKDSLSGIGVILLCATCARTLEYAANEL